MQIEIEMKIEKMEIEVEWLSGKFVAASANPTCTPPSSPSSRRCATCACASCPRRVGFGREGVPAAQHDAGVLHGAHAAVPGARGRGRGAGSGSTGLTRWRTTPTTKVTFEAERWFDAPKQVVRLHRTLNKKAIGRAYKKQIKPLLA